MRFAGPDPGGSMEGSFKTPLPKCHQMSIAIRHILYTIKYIRARGWRPENRRYTVAKRLQVHKRMIRVNE